MKVLRYNELDTSNVRSQYEKTVERIRQNDFYSAKVKKLAGTPYYRAELDYANRLLFKIVSYQGVKYALMLEVILNHAYEKSRFLQGTKVDETKIEAINHNNLEEYSAEPIAYINTQQSHFNFLDKIISFDDVQQAIFLVRPPLIVIGSAGSGKTMLTLEHLKLCMNEVLYVTGSSYLVQNARELYYSYDYANEAQNVEFLSYRELLETIKVPEGKEIDFYAFAGWLKKFNKGKSFQDANKLYEEFKGVITGNRPDKPFLSKEEYLNLGVKQSIYHLEERPIVYELFEKYCQFLSTQGLYDINVLSFEYLSLSQGKYDFIVIDEVQDFTPVQLSLILKTLKHPHQFILCGDSNQIVHPNFFSWSKVKSLFYEQPSHVPQDLIRILNKNYRNAASITVIANKILKIKNARFGSIDKESHYLVESQSLSPGEVYCLLNSQEIRHELNTKTAKSTRFAVIVLREEQKEAASQYFQTPLIFSIYEAKGLEYDNVILYNLISSEEKKFRDIVENVSIEDLEKALVYGRVKDKNDRSLEIYKFYINALYVAITRAIQNVYFIEDKESHPLFDLLGIKPSHEMVPIQIQNSSLEEWQKEANRLALQGKQTQAEAIRHTILNVQNPPWQVLTPSALIPLQEKALDTQLKNKEARLLLFEYALVYQQRTLLNALAAIGFTPALKPDKNKDLLLRKYFIGYSANPTSVMRQIASYGIDFRNIFNQTPLMIACGFGQEALVKLLIDKGANPLLTDNLGRNAFQIILQKAFSEQKFAQHKLSGLYHLLSPNSLDVQVEGKLIKLDVKQMEFFLVNAMIAIAHQKELARHQLWSFVVNDFLAPLQYFPERIVPEKRKQRAYISSILSKNEIYREDPYNRKLFLRVKLGHYIINPGLKVRVNEDWISLYELLNLTFIKESLEIGVEEEVVY